MKPAELLLHPVRLRVVVAGVDGAPFTTLEMARRLGDVPKATLYRHLALLADGGLLEVASESVVNGIVERRYRVVQVQGDAATEAAPTTTRAEHRQRFMAVIASLLGEFNAYLDRPKANPEADSVSYRQTSLWLTPAERTALLDELTAALQRRAGNERSTTRRRHLLTTLFFPAEPNMQTSELSLLRDLADEGNEAAAHRLVELAAERGDVEELRRLVDNGVDEAEQQLLRIAIELGDTDALRRLVDDGNDDAEKELVKIAVELGDAAELRRLVDNGNDDAERALVALAIARRDVAELRRLAGDGNDDAEAALAKLIRQMGR